MESVIYIYALVVLAAVCVPTLWLARTFVLRRRFTCPEKKRPVRVEFVCRGSHQNVKPLRVKSCSAFKPPRKVKCDEKCMGILGRTPAFRRRPRPASARAD